MKILTGDVIRANLPAQWRLMNRIVRARFLTGDFASGIRFVDAVAEAAETADHHPDIDLRYLHVDLALVSHSAGGVTQRDLDMAETISGIAARLGLDLDPRSRRQRRAIEVYPHPATIALFGLSRTLK